MYREEILKQCAKDRALTLAELSRRLDMTINQTRQFLQEKRKEGLTVRYWVQSE